MVPVQRSQRNPADPPYWDKEPGGFIRGPLPLAWMERAARLGHSRLVIGLALWYRAGRYGNRVKCSQVIFERFGIDPSTRSRALDDLAQAGLIRQEKKGNRARVATILPCPQEDGGAPPADPA